MKREKKKEFNLMKVIAVIIIIVAIIAVVVNVINKNNNETTNTIINNNISAMEEENLGKYVTKTEEGTNLNVSPNVNTTKTLNDLEISDIRLTYKDGVTNILGTVRNTKNEKIEETKIYIQLIDENGEEIYKLKGIIGEAEAGETVRLNSSITANFVNVYDINILEMDE